VAATIATTSKLRVAALALTTRTEKTTTVWYSISLSREILTRRSRLINESLSLLNKGKIKCYIQFLYNVCRAGGLFLNNNFILTYIFIFRTDFLSNIRLVVKNANCKTKNITISWAYENIKVTASTEEFFQKLKNGRYRRAFIAGTDRFSSPISGDWKFHFQLSRTH